jgi:hypothetical protein
MKLYAGITLWLEMYGNLEALSKPIMMEFLWD